VCSVSLRFHAGNIASIFIHSFIKTLNHTWKGSTSGIRGRLCCPLPKNPSAPAFSDVGSVSNQNCCKGFCFIHNVEKHCLSTSYLLSVFLLGNCTCSCFVLPSYVAMLLRVKTVHRVNFWKLLEQNFLHAGCLFCCPAKSISSCNNSSMAQACMSGVAFEFRGSTVKGVGMHTAEAKR